MSVADYLHLSNLPVLNGQVGRAVPKGESRLQVSERAEKDEAKAEERWKASIWKRDKGLCRWCFRKVRKTIEHVSERGECHHISGKDIKAIRWDRRNGLLLCSGPCHERVTGRVNERWVILSRHKFKVEGVKYRNADMPVTFERVA
jgi:hypothetical protein